MPRSITQMRWATPKRASMAVTISFTVVTSVRLPGKTSYPRAARAVTTSARHTACSPAGGRGCSPAARGVWPRLAFEVGARHVVEEEVIFHLEEFAEAGAEVRLQCGLVGQEVIQGRRVSSGRRSPVATWHPEEILQGGLPIPGLGEVEFAGPARRGAPGPTPRIVAQGMASRPGGRRHSSRPSELQRPATRSSRARHRRRCGRVPGACGPGGRARPRRGGQGVKEIRLRPPPRVKRGGPKARARTRPCGSSSPRWVDGLLAKLASPPGPSARAAVTCRTFPSLRRVEWTEIHGTPGIYVMRPGRRQWVRSPLQRDSGRGALTGRGVTRADQGNFSSVRGAVRSSASAGGTAVFRHGP